MTALARFALTNPFVLGTLCFLLVIAPILGIAAIHKVPEDKGR